MPTSQSKQPLSICIATMEFKGLGNYYGGIGSANYELAKTLLNEGKINWDYTHKIERS